MSTISPYTCITCRVAFKDFEIQREHYKSDWHKYNLKRKVAGFPPVTVEEFQRRVLAQRSENKQLETTQHLSCKICRKNFNSKNQYENHILSNKHKYNSLRYNSNNELLHDVEVSDTKESNSSISIKHTASKNHTNAENEIEVDSDVESVDSDEWLEDTENSVKNNCLFCNHHSRSLLRNLKHMTVAHSFFIADPEYCIDVEGLLAYLGKKIFIEYMCIWCNDSGKVFQSAEAVRSHMLDKGHCKMLHEGEALIEYSKFYDYSSSYPDEADPDTEVEISELDDTSYQLVLPSGNVIGHRSLMIYYKQSHLNKVAAVSNRHRMLKLMSQYRALGWKNTGTEIIRGRMRDIKHMQRVKAKYSTQLQFKANKLQKNFRRKDF